MDLRSLISSGSTKAPLGIVSSTKRVHLMVQKKIMKKTTIVIMDMTICNLDDIE